MFLLTTIMNALILVDLQNDFMPGGALAVADGDRVVPIANRLMPHFDLVVATQDWHPADHLSFASQHPGRNIGDVIDLDGLEQVLWPDHCVQGTPGAALHTDLNTGGIRRVVQKGTNRSIDSYSGFFDNGHRQATGLAEFLHEQGVTDVAVMGLATDYCVKFTALDAVKMGLATTLIEDACRGVDLHPGDVSRAMEEMKRAGVKMVTSPPDEVLAQTSHLRFVTRGGWSYVERTTASGVVCIVATTRDNRIVLVEQYRPPVAGRVIELPAGLCGDLADQAEEPLEVAAMRELLEETGYRATRMRNVATVASSAGMTNEVVTFFVADDIEKVASGGGDESEDITIHEIPLDQIDDWLHRAQETGKLVDARVYGGLYFLQRQGGTVET